MSDTTYHAEVPFEEILADPNRNYRKFIDPEKLQELANNFVNTHRITDGEQWMLQAVSVELLPEDHPSGKKYELILGARRYSAACLLLEQDAEANAFASMVPVKITKIATATAVSYTQLIENVQREATNDMDLAYELGVLRGAGESVQSLCETLGKSKGWIDQRLSLLKLVPECRDALGAGTISFTHARQLVRVKNKDDQRDFLTDVLEDTLTPGALKTSVDAYFEELKAAAPVHDKAAPDTASTTAVEDALDKEPTERNDYSDLKEDAKPSEEGEEPKDAYSSEPLPPEAPEGATDAELKAHDIALVNAKMLAQGIEWFTSDAQGFVADGALCPPGALQIKKHTQAAFLYGVVAILKRIQETDDLAVEADDLWDALPKEFRDKPEALVDALMATKA